MRARAVVVRAVCAVLAAAAAAWAASWFGIVFVGGDSMSPALLRGDLVVYARRGADPRPGEIVLVSKPGWPKGVLHRVEVLLPDGSLVLRGDANRTPDVEPVEPVRVLGVVRAVVPSGSAVRAMERTLRRWYDSALTTAYARR